MTIIVKIKTESDPFMKNPRVCGRRTVRLPGMAASVPKYQKIAVKEKCT